MRKYFTKWVLWTWSLTLDPQIKKGYPQTTGINHKFDSNWCKGLQDREIVNIFYRNGGKKGKIDRMKHM